MGSTETPRFAILAMKLDKPLIFRLCRTHVSYAVLYGVHSVDSGPKVSAIHIFHQTGVPCAPQTPTCVSLTRVSDTSKSSVIAWKGSVEKRALETWVTSCRS